MSRTQLDYLMVILVNITIPVVTLWKCYSGEISASAASMIGLVTAAIGNGSLFLGFGIRGRRGGQKKARNIVVFGLLLGIAGAGGTAVGAHLLPVQDDFTQLAYSNKPLDEIHPEQKRLAVKLLRRREQLSTGYTRLAATAKPMFRTLFTRIVREPFRHPKHGGSHKTGSENRLRIFRSTAASNRRVPRSARTH